MAKMTLYGGGEGGQSAHVSQCPIMALIKGGSVSRVLSEVVAKARSYTVSEKLLISIAF